MRSFHQSPTMRIVPLLFLLLICNSTRAQLLDAIALDTVRTYRSLERALEDPMRVYKLDLSKQKLKELPEELRRLPNLNSLDLGHNKLKTLPEWISEFAHLQEFSANNNRMVNFPEAICALRHLKRLDMSRNALISLPACLGRLEQLTSLDLWSNDLATFPDELERMEALRYVDLRVIQFSPKEMEHIADLWPRAKIQFSAPCNCGM
ncbi:MAG: leucine-rich repeat domain-containing protein [Flavobacteriales bacterium]|nr:leucine-rich repeat domain-containing protein [Flavobacteriales bacterium]MBP6698619.1 leucine-rich repeat domain-containing protein [Flavobacteriales bacterium]